MKGGNIGSVCFLTYLLSLAISVYAEDPASVEVSERSDFNDHAPFVLSLDEIVRMKEAQNALESTRRSGRVDEESYERSRTNNRAVAITAFTYPDRMYGYQSLIQCDYPGDMYYLTLYGDCLICSCVVEGTRLVSKCAQCSEDCGGPDPPAPPSEPKSTCFPFTPNVPFENPLNPCQICLCKQLPGSLGQVIDEVEFTCVKNPKCIIPSTIAPSPQPTTSRPTRPITITIPWNPTTPTTWRPPTTPWNPVTILPPPSPRTLRPPHSSCAPFQPNVPYTNPEDECEVCVCTEYKNQWTTEIDVRCKTKAECCVIPLPDPEVVYLNPICRYHALEERFVIPGYLCKEFVCRMEYRNVYLEVINTPQCYDTSLIIPDAICRGRQFGEEFVNPNDGCRVCRCEIFGSIVVPVCKKNLGCGDLSAAVSISKLIYIAPFCRHQPPNVEIVVGCNVCQCSSIYVFIVSNCRPRRECEGRGLAQIQSGMIGSSQLSVGGQYQQIISSNGQLLGNDKLVTVNNQLSGLNAQSLLQPAATYVYPKVQESNIKYTINKAYPEIQESSIKYILDNKNTNQYQVPGQVAINGYYTGGVQTTAGFNHAGGVQSIAGFNHADSLSTAQLHHADSLSTAELHHTDAQSIAGFNHADALSTAQLHHTDAQSIAGFNHADALSTAQLHHAGGLSTAQLHHADALSTAQLHHTDAQSIAGFNHAGAQTNTGFNHAGGWNYYTVPNQYGAIREGTQSHVDVVKENRSQVVEHSESEHTSNVQALEELFGTEDNNDYVNVPEVVESPKVKIKSGRPSQGN